MNNEEIKKAVEALLLLGFKINNIASDSLDVHGYKYAFIDDEGFASLSDVKEPKNVAKLIKDTYKLVGKQDLIEQIARENEVHLLNDHECD